MQCARAAQMGRFQPPSAPPSHLSSLWQRLVGNSHLPPAEETLKHGGGSSPIKKPQSSQLVATQAPPASLLEDIPEGHMMQRRWGG